MLSFKSIVLIAAAFASTIEASGVVGVAPVAAPLVAPAHIGYAHAVPDNVPPYASQVNIESRAVNVPYAAPYVAAAPPSFYSSPYVSPYSFPAPLASYSSYPYGAAPLVRSAYGLAPAFVR